MKTENFYSISTLYLWYIIIKEIALIVRDKHCTAVFLLDIKIGYLENVPFLKKVWNSKYYDFLYSFLQAHIFHKVISRYVNVLQI